ncbi:MAG: rod-binding protein [Alphaproteobacteria bacterium]|nr:rod-binding protein [Alphaproteobacteria bacterium]
MNALTGNGIAPNAAFETATFALQNAAGAPVIGPNNMTRETAVDFEAFFLSQVFAEMFAGIETDPVFGGGPGETVFRSMMIQEFGTSVARSGGVGIADSVMREMIALQEEN